MTGWSIVTPVKPLGLAKSRLRATLPAAAALSAYYLSGPDPFGALDGDFGLPGDGDADWHAAIALAMALDTVTALLGAVRVDRVVVVTDDPVATAALGDLGAVCVRDAPADGLNAALRQGASVAALLSATDGRGRAGTASVGADLPALKSTDLDAALRAAERLGARAFVPDATGTGTTLLAAPGRLALEPAYGPGSALLHARDGALDLTSSLVVPSLRQDVDTAADLDAVRSLGLGPRTAALLEIGVSSDGQKAPTPARTAPIHI
ncbi:NTP transferase domain-containing protein [Cryptosporangium phraense]|uniref:Phosphoenolpyruvate guanylyltransferase n=1 Tax=Cryptosporangium phraense TaxID=2593070 RepID=A0A545AUI3_9ACTN|nr:NTP transferase domain-containing protein [Cryptosporangium phraense]TQS44255.1 2-phospho-L-lactate guanylyltransferase [Cryptosporangium phraense]